MAQIPIHNSLRRRQLVPYLIRLRNQGLSLDQGLTTSTFVAVQCKEIK